MVAYPLSIPVGFAGDLTRSASDCTIMSERMLRNKTVNPIWQNYYYGMPVKLGADGKSVSPFVGGETADQLWGFVVREYPGRATLTADGINGDFMGYLDSVGAQIIPVLKRGSFAARVQNTAVPVKGGTVYIRIANPTDSLRIGGIEAADGGSDTIKLANAYFNGGKDDNSITEIAYNI